MAAESKILHVSNLVAGNYHGPARRRVHIKRGSLQVEQVTAVLKCVRDENKPVMVDWRRLSG